MKPRFRLATRKARELLQKAGVVGPPVPVGDLAALAGAEVQYEPFDGELSGMIMRRGGKALIGINTKHSLGLQRFSLAHELGHLLLHRSKAFHLDGKHPIRLRDARSSTGEDIDEVEANQFAAELLMPEAFLARDVKEVAWEEAEVATGKLAERYQVSDQAMSIRLTVLGYLR